MFLFITRFLKGMIIGWIMSLIMYLVKRALAKSFGNMPQQNSQHPQYKPQPSQPQHDVVETIWAGMTTDQLRTAFGAPQSKEKNEANEIWVYPNLNGHGTQTRITIENNAIKQWQDIQVE